MRLLALIFILNLLKINAQDLDSLVSVAFRMHSDTDKVNLFYKEGFSKRAIDPQYSFNCAKYAEKFAKASDRPYYIAKAGNLLGVLYFRKHDLITSLSYHKKALNLRTIINDKKGIAISQTNLGNLYGELKKYTLAEDAYLKALQINNELNDKKQVGNCLLNLGVLNAEQASANKDSVLVNVAKNYFEKAIQNGRLRFDYELEAECLNNLAVINTILERFDEAIANAENSIKIKDLMDNEMEKADSYLNISNAYFKKDDTRWGLNNLWIADSIIKKYNYTSAAIQSLKIKSDYYNRERNYEKAYQSLTQLRALEDSLDEVNKQINLKNNFIENENFKIQTGINDFKFPWVLLNIFIIMAISITALAFKLKR